MIENLYNKFRVLTRKFLNTSLKKRILSHAFWLLISSILSKFLLLIGTMLVARILGKGEYGELGMIRTTIQMFVVFAGFGIGSTASKFIAENRDDNPEKTLDIYIITNSFA